MGRKALDHIYRGGYNCPVVLIHGLGVEIDIHQISLVSEALYKVGHLGSFGLFQSPLQFGMLLGIGSLLLAHVSMHDLDTDIDYKKN